MSDEKTQRQVALEAESITLGVTRYRREQPLPWRDAAGETKEETDLTPGKALLKRALTPVVAAIEAFIEKARTAKAGRRHSALNHLEAIAPEHAAYIAVRTAINSASLNRPLQQCLLGIAQGIEDHLNFTRLKEQAPGLFAKVQNQLDGKTTHGKHRKAVMNKAMDFAKIDRLVWSTRNRLSLGQALLEIVVEATGYVEIKTVALAHNNTPTILAPTKEIEEWLKDAHARCELLAPVLLPMIIPPKPWRTPFSGGYISGAVRNFRMVKTRNRQYLDELASLHMPEVYDAVNAVQGVAWRINKSVLDVMRAVWDGGSDLGGLPSKDKPLPLRPTGVPKDVALDKLPEEQRASIRSWKQEAARVHDDNARLGSKRLGMAQKLWIAERFAPEEELYFPHQIDWRGRIYPSVPFVNPQADDSGKALLEFAEGKALGENGAFWLAVHIANLFGVDKVSFDERVAWVMENEDAILDSATRPLDGARFWANADSPYGALAACFEWAGYRLVGNDYVSHLPVAMDGSCSGLQHFSAMLRDSVGGAAVNLVPAAKPADIYTAVGKVAQVKVDADMEEIAMCWHGGKVKRKLVKQPCMTLCYGSTLRGMQDQIEGALRKLDNEEGTPYLEGEDNFKASRYLGRVVRESIGEVVIAAKLAMDWLQQAARIAASESLPVRWTTPVGLVVQQEYKVEIGKRYNVFFNGRRVRVVVAEEGDKLDKKRQSSGISPNFVHSLDSAHLMSTVNTLAANGVRSLACVHDSFGTHAADTDILHVAVRRAFVEQYRGDVLQSFRDELVQQLPKELAALIPEVPPKGDLDLEAVLGAEYSFA